MLSKCFKNKTQGILDIRNKTRDSKIHLKYFKSQKRVPEILSNYCKNKTQRVLEMLSNCFKNNTQGVLDIHLSYFKNKKGVFQATSKTRYNGSPRFFQITSKTKQKESEVPSNYSKNETHSWDSRDSTKLLHKLNTSVFREFFKFIICLMCVGMSWNRDSYQS